MRANAWQGGQDPMCVFEALAYAAVLDAVRALDAVAIDERTALVRTARRALLQAGGRSDEEAEALALVLPLAKRGLLALETRAGSGAHEQSVATTFQTHPSATEIVAMCNGRPDAFGAASVAVHAEACARCAGEVRLLGETVGEAETPLLAAAADLAPMLSPMNGKRVGVCDELHAEAILFGGRTIAVYANDDVAVRLVADGCVTRDMRPGYWAGELSSEAASVEATLHVGDKSARISLRFN